MKVKNRFGVVNKMSSKSLKKLAWPGDDNKVKPVRSE